MTRKSRSIRVNLRFGPRTPPALLQLVESLPPYKRAQKIRRLLEQTFRHPPGETQRQAPSRPHPIEPTFSDRVTTQDSSLSNELKGLLGRSVKM